MHRLHRINPRTHAASEALPDVLGLAKHEIEFRRGQVAMIAGQPNDGKSPLALFAMLRWAQFGLNALYFSADTDEFTTLRRAAATVTGQPQSYIEAQMQAGWSGVADALADLKGGVAFSFETDPTYQHLYEETIAFWEAWGDYPAIIVVDNLMDVVGENEDEYGTMRDTSKALKRLARVTSSCVVVLHHCNESEKRGDHPPARREITGKVAQKAELILTLQYDDASNEMRIAPVKNRNGGAGKKDPSGFLFYRLKSDPATCRFLGPNYEPLGGVA